MNKSKRNKHRGHAEELRLKVKALRLSKHICENCGMPGCHWHVIKPISVAGIVNAVDDSEGFYSCTPKKNTV